MSTTNSATQERRASVVVEDVDTNADGEVEVTVGELRNIETPADASAEASDGYGATVTDVDGNTVTVVVYEGVDGGGAMDPVDDGDAVANVHVSAFGY